MTCKKIIRPVFDKCPCGSGNSYTTCCDLNGIPYRKPTVTKSVFKSGLVTSGCYASSLNDCDGGVLTSEHFFSKSVLHLLSDSIIEVKGWPWCQDKMKRISIESFKARILCKKHNNNLSGLDDTAGKLFDLFIQYQDKNLNGWHLLSGEDIEKWMLKLLIGLVASNNVYNSEKTDVNDAPLENWVNILYGSKDMPDGWGLYLFELPKNTEPQKEPIRISVSSHEPNSEAWVMGVGLMGFNFLLNMTTYHVKNPDVTLYHPWLLDFGNDTAIEFSWENSNYEKIVEIS